MDTTVVSSAMEYCYVVTKSHLRVTTNEGSCRGVEASVWVVAYMYVCMYGYAMAITLHSATAVRIEVVSEYECSEVMICCCVLNEVVLHQCK